MLDTYIQKWSLDDLEFFTESLCGHLYKVRHKNAHAILKIYKDYGRLEESRGAELLKIWPDKVSVSVLENDENAVLLEYLPGNTLRMMVENGDDDKATEIIAHLVKDLHAISMPEYLPDLPHLHDWFETLFKTAQDKTHAYKQQLEVAVKVAQDLLSDNPLPKLLHGDIHHENIILAEDGTPKLIDPKGIIGDPVYDIANVMRNPDMKGLVTKERIDRQISIFHEILGYDKNRILQFGFVHTWLSCCWSWMDGDRDMENSIHEAEIFYEMVN